MSNQATKAKRVQDREPPTGSGRSRGNKSRTRALVDLNELGELIALLKENGLTEFELEREGFRIHLRQGIDYQSEGAADNASSAETPTLPAARSKGAAAFAAATPPQPRASKTAVSEDQDLYIIPSPI